MSELSDEKKCTCCQNTYPRMSDYFSFVYRKNRNKSYPKSRCKICSKKYDREYRRTYVAKFRETQRRWTQTPKGVFKSLKNSIRGHKVLITQEMFAEWYQSQPKICCYCGITVEEMKLIPDRYNNKVFRLTVDRLDSSKGYEEGNLALCCLRCNHIKGDFFTQSEMVEIGTKFIQPKWRKSAKQI